MILLLDAVVLALLLTVVTGRSLTRFAATRLRFEWLLLPLLVIQLMLPTAGELLGGERTVLVGIWLVVMCGLVLIVLANRSYLGILLAGLGIALNALVIAANWGMPVSEHAVSIVVGSEYSMSIRDDDVVHIRLCEGTRLPPLADVIPLPGPAWHRGVLSAGDIILAVGAALFVYEASRER